MTASIQYRLAIYLMDSYKQKVLLTKATDGPFAGKLVPLSFPLPPQAFPQQFLNQYFRETFNVGIEFVFHPTSIPAVLDSNTVQTMAPFFTQVCRPQQGAPFVEMIYLAFATAPFKLGDPAFTWCRAEDLVGRIAPKHVKRTVKQILQIQKK